MEQVLKVRARLPLTRLGLFSLLCLGATAAVAHFKKKSSKKPLSSLNWENIAKMSTFFTSKVTETDIFEDIEDQRDIKKGTIEK